MADVFKIKLRDGTSRKWYGKVRLAGTWKRVPLFTDRKASQAHLRKLQADADQRASGVLRRSADFASIPLSTHVEHYVEHVRRHHQSRDHLHVLETVLGRLLQVTGWRLMADIDAEQASRTIATLKLRNGQDATPAYKNNFIKKAKSFCRWLHESGRADRHLLTGLRRMSEKKAIRRRARRSASSAELRGLLLLEHLDECPDRRLCYALASYNGARRNEIASLTWGQLHLDERVPFVELGQKMGESDEHDTVPLHPYVLGLLHQRVRGMPGVNVVENVPDVATLEKDLAKAGFEMIDGRGRRLDFHGLRHTFETMLDRTGTSRATKKRLMRHAAEDVTDSYTHADLAEMQQALNRIPQPLHLPTVGHHVTQNRKTGTEGGAFSSDLRAVDSLVDHQLDQTPTGKGHFVSASYLPNTPGGGLVGAAGAVTIPAGVRTCRNQSFGVTENAPKSLNSLDLRPGARVD